MSRQVLAAVYARPHNKKARDTRMEDRPSLTLLSKNTRKNPQPVERHVVIRMSHPDGTVWDISLPGVSESIAREFMAAKFIELST